MDRLEAAESALEIVFDRASHFSGGAVVLRNSNSSKAMVELRQSLLNALPS